ncbi:hypothetical protein SDC9_131948 [bioreactor metagenome]|uniref:Uncharacterized protein n=1 Tax=bioreactor metagenome TaxID=1076179 RepID=A0A645D8E0_9ZZZZ
MMAFKYFLIITDAIKVITNATIAVIIIVIAILSNILLFNIPLS